MTKHFVVIFGRDSNKDYRNFHKDFVGDARISNFWHYIKSSYLIITSMSENELSKHFSKCARKYGISTTHLVIEIDLSRRQGMLTKDAWKWIGARATRR